MDEAIDGLTEIVTWSVDFNSTSGRIAAYIAASMLGISLVFVVWALATKKENARTYLLAWMVAIVFIILFILK